MTTRQRRGLRSAEDRVRSSKGQVLVIFALSLLAIVAMAGLLVDGGMAWATRRAAQAAADTAALAAAQAVSIGATDNGASEARSVAAANGFSAPTDCDGKTLSGGSQVNGVTVNRPPLSGPHSDAVNGNTTDNRNYIEVIAARPMSTTFASAVGQSCWMVSARAVAVLATSSAFPCSFCSLNNSKQGHTLLLQNGASLRVDGDIYTNSSNGCGSTSPHPNGLTQCNDGSICTLKDFKVCGDGFDIFGTPELSTCAVAGFNGACISAKTISVVGGWETHDGNFVFADSPVAPNFSTDPPTYSACPYQPDPPGQASPTSNVCIHMPPILDPFAAVSTPTTTGLSVPTVTSCAPISGAPVVAASGTSGKQKLTEIKDGNQHTICPGIYYGGISIHETGTTVYMQPGIYYIINNDNANGFAVTKGASVDGSRGVMIYNSGTKGAVTITQLADGVDIVADPDYANNENEYPDSPLPLMAIKSSKSSANPGDTVTFTFSVRKSGAATLSGVVKFWDGQSELTDGTLDLETKTRVPSSSLCPAVTAKDSGDFSTTCKIKWTPPEVGTHGIWAVFESSNPNYSWGQAVLSPRQVVKASGVLGGTTLLAGLKSGPYKGFVIFQDPANKMNMLLSPQSPLPACTGSWMTAGIPTTAPPACGDLGGISGTIYASHSDAQVQITASGIGDIQVVAGKILITSGADARFAYTPNKFALGGVRLVE